MEGSDSYDRTYGINEAEQPSYLGPVDGTEVFSERIALLKEYHLGPGERHLTPEQEQALLTAIADGRTAESRSKDAGLTSKEVGRLLKIIENAEKARTSLAENYLGLVVAMAYASVGAVKQGLECDDRINSIRRAGRSIKTISKFAFEQAVLDDRIQEGAVGLWCAVNEATPEQRDERGNLTSFAIVAARAIYDAIAAHSKTEKNIVEIPVADIPRATEDPVDAIIRITGAELIRDALKRLGQARDKDAQDEVQVAMLEFGLDGNGARSLDQIAIALDMHRNKVRRLSGQILRKLSGNDYMKKLVDAAPIVPWRTAPDGRLSWG